MTQELNINIPLDIIGELSDDQLIALSRAVRPHRIERNANRQLIIMPPTGFDSGAQNMAVGSRLFQWTRARSKGVAADSSTGYKLPNGAIYSPDASWVSDERLSGISKEDRQRFLPACPDFLIELMSPSDRLPILQAKMQEWIANGARLAWLIDPMEEKTYIYRTGQPEPEIIQGFDQTLSGEDVLPGFTLPLADLR